MSKKLSQIDKKIESLEKQIDKLEEGRRKVICELRKKHVGKYYRRTEEKLSPEYHHVLEFDNKTGQLKTRSFILDDNYFCYSKGFVAQSFSSDNWEEISEGIFELNFNAFRCASTLQLTEPY
jgi:hypothetical protein